MKGVRWLMALALGFGLIIGFAGCEDQDTISKADRCGNSIIKFQKNYCSPWRVKECLEYPNATLNCVLNASGADEEETCNEMWKCIDVGDYCWAGIYECGLTEYLEEEYDIEFDSWYDAWAYCAELAELDEDTFECIISTEDCGELADCLGIELPG